jgi:hypothetical protein
MADGSCSCCRTCLSATGEADGLARKASGRPASAFVTRSPQIRTIELATNDTRVAVGVGNPAEGRLRRLVWLVAWCGGP